MKLLYIDEVDSKNGSYQAEKEDMSTGFAIVIIMFSIVVLILPVYLGIRMMQYCNRKDELPSIWGLFLVAGVAVFIWQITTLFNIEAPKKHPRHDSTGSMHADIAVGGIEAAGSLLDKGEQVFSLFVCFLRISPSLGALMAICLAVPTRYVITNKNIRENDPKDNKTKPNHKM